MSDKNTTIIISKNGFKPFFKQSHFALTSCGRFNYREKEHEKMRKKDVLYATEAILNITMLVSRFHGNDMSRSVFQATCLQVAEPD